MTQRTCTRACSHSRTLTRGLATRVPATRVLATHRPAHPPRRRHTPDCADRLAAVSPHRMGPVVNCAAYAEGCRVANVSVEDISEVLKVPGQFVWVGLNEPDETLLRQIQQEFGLHDLAVEDALSAHQRPKLEEYGQGLFVVLRTVEMQDGHLALGETHIFVGPRYVVSVRHGSTRSYAEVRAHCEARPHLLRKGPGFVLYALMDFVVDRYFPIANELEDRLDGLEKE